jgi:hypothetical protein
VNGLYDDDVEVYNEVDESKMVGEYNTDYLDPVSYDFVETSFAFYQTKF